MELDRVVWRRAALRVQRVARAAQWLWLAAMLAPPLVAVVAFPDLLVEALLVSVVSLVLVRRVVLLAARGTVTSVQALIRAGGPDLSRLQVSQLLRDGVAHGDGGVWVTMPEESCVRLVAEGREPGTSARSSSPWVWAMGGGGV